MEEEPQLTNGNRRIVHIDHIDLDARRASLASTITLS